MGNLAITYQHIANILSFKTSDLQLEKELSNPSFDWDSIVVEGSKHLVLPTIYCRLKSRQLLHVLPLELKDYLEEITSINRNRNLAIISQIESISKLLNEHKINYVFLKGAALLVLDIYSDVAERMVGDIDILIDTIQLETAYNLLKNNSYKESEPAIGEKYFGHTHLPRLKPLKHIASIELHKKLFLHYTYEPLNCDKILIEKRNYNKQLIPKHEYILLHNILSFQINDKGAIYKSINFRSAYDTLILFDKKINYRKLNKNSVIVNYINIVNSFFTDINETTSYSPNFSTAFYRFKLKNNNFYRFWNKLTAIYILVPLLVRRISKLILNKSYRKAIINDRKRLYTHFKSVFTKF